MADLFRYIQHAFVVPSAPPAIDVDRQSDLQNDLRDAISNPKVAIERLGGDLRKTFEKANIDITGAPVSHVITAIKRHLYTLNSYGSEIDFNPLAKRRLCVAACRMGGM